MDDEVDQLEAELKRLRPAEPSRRLVDGIARELAGSVSRERTRSSEGRGSSEGRFSWLWAAALPAAAALAIGLAWTRRSAGPAPAAEVALTAETLKPVAAENVLYSAIDEGFVTLEDGTPARRERLQYVDTITWRNPRTNASLKWTVPREEVRVVPVILQ